MSEWLTVDWREVTVPGYRVAVLWPEQADVEIVPIVGWLVVKSGWDTRVVPAVMSTLTFRWEPVMEPASDLRLLRPGDPEPTPAEIGKWLHRCQKEREAAETLRNEPF